jgi:hypothetical protein
MARAQRAPMPAVYQIKVTLKGSKPPIWRRIQVTRETTLAKLHRILQRVMGWEGYHLYQFMVLWSAVWSTATQKCWRRWRAMMPGG